MKPVIDTLYQTEPILVVPITCPCCTKCWLVVKAKRGVGRCVFGGPFLGYVEVADH